MRKFQCHHGRSYENVGRKDGNVRVGVEHDGGQEERKAIKLQGESIDSNVYVSTFAQRDRDTSIRIGT